MKVEAYDGFAELMKEMERDAGIIENPKTVEAVTMAGANIIVPEVKNQAQKQGLNRVAKSIGSEFDEKEKVAVVGWGGEMNTTASAHGFMGPWFEYGTGERRTKGKSKGGKRRAAHSTGVLRAKPHMRPGFQNKKNQAADAMIGELGKKLK